MGLQSSLLPTLAFFSMGFLLPRPCPVWLFRLQGLGQKQNRFVFLQQTYRPLFGLAIRANVTYTINNCSLLG